MQRRTMLIAAMTASAALAGFVVAGTALGADWYEYEGRLAAGQAFIVPVPANADALSFALVPMGEAPSAKLVVFDSSDNRVGFFSLEGESAAVDLVSPQSGGYLVYVYEVKEASLSARVQMKDAPEEGALAIQKGATIRQDKPIARDHSGAFSKDLVVEVPNKVVFATVLYQGTVENLNAAVESPKGLVLSVAGESGTAYSPGLGVGASSAREADLANVVGGQYTVTVQADELDGSIFLTTLAFDRPAAPMPVEPHHAKKAPTAPGAPAPAAPGVEPMGAPLLRGIPIAVEIRDETLALALPSWFACPMTEEDHEDHDDDEHDGTGSANESDTTAHVCPQEASHGDHKFPWSGEGRSHVRESATISIYDGKDALVGVYSLKSSREPMVLLEGLEAGEYVIFVHGNAASTKDKQNDAAAFLVRPTDPEAPLTWRAIALVDAAVSVMSGELVDHEETLEIKMATPPLGAWAHTTEDSIAAFYEATLTSPAGEVFRQHSLMRGPFFHNEWSYYAYNDLEALVAGTYTLDVRALAYQGETVLTWTTYDRAFAFGEAPVVVAEDKDEGDDGEPAAPAPAPGTGLLEDLIAGLGRL